MQQKQKSKPATHLRRTQTILALLSSHKKNKVEENTTIIA